jgi:hypothetical protein
MKAQSTQASTGTQAQAQARKLAGTGAQGDQTMSIATALASKWAKLPLAVSLVRAQDALRQAREELDGYKADAPRSAVVPTPTQADAPTLVGTIAQKPTATKNKKAPATKNQVSGDGGTCNVDGCPWTITGESTRKDPKQQKIDHINKHKRAGVQCEITNTLTRAQIKAQA